MQCLSRSLRASLRFCHPLLRCGFHNKTAKFATVDSQGQPVEREINVWLGDAHESFVMIPKEIGNTIKTYCSWLDGWSFATDPQQCPLIFYHTSRHFAPRSSLYPRLSIPQDLPQQSDANTSPATLYLFGETHTIALDGTPDDEFAKQARDIDHELGSALDSLRNK